MAHLLNIRPAARTASRRIAIAATAAAMLVLAACSDGTTDITGGGNGGGGNTSDSYTGILAGASTTQETGVIALTIGSSGSSDVSAATEALIANVTGTITFMAQLPITVQGSFANGSFTATGGGYSLLGAVSSSAITGTYSGPNGTGVFSLVVTTSAAPAVTYCGTYAAQAPSADHGTWSIVVGGNLAAGVYVNAQQQSYGLAGTATPTMVSLQNTTGAALQASGTLTSTSASGTYQAGSTVGTWSGGSCTAP